jgi:hypothetical protein
MLLVLKHLSKVPTELSVLASAGSLSALLEAA